MARRKTVTRATAAQASQSAARARIAPDVTGTHSDTHAVQRQRLPSIDALRGLAIVAMVAYHFAFDLRMLGVTHTDFEHATFWLAARATIVTSFVTLVGISLALAGDAQVPLARHLQRLARIAACALLVTIASYAIFPNTFIYFGVLHCIAVASLAAWPLRNQPAIAAVAGVAIVAAGLTINDALFDSRALSWIGFMTHKPATEDYVPLFPWSGVVLLGITAGHFLARANRRADASRPVSSRAPPPRWLGFLGRHSLAVYMIHQPVLIGALAAVLWLGGWLH